MSKIKALTTFILILLQVTILLSNEMDDNKDNKKSEVVVSPINPIIDSIQTTAVIPVDSALVVLIDSLKLHHGENLDIPSNITDIINDFLWIDSNIVQIKDKNRAFQLIESYAIEKNDSTTLANLHLKWALTTQLVLPDTSRIHCDKAFSLFQTVKDSIGQINALMLSSILADNKKDYKKAMEILEQAKTLAELKGSYHLLSKIFDSFANISEKQGDFTIAIQYRTKYFEFKEKHISKDNDYKLVALQSQLEEEKKISRESKLQAALTAKAAEKKQKTVLILLSCLLFTLLTFTVLAYLSKVKNNKKLAEQNIIIQDQAKSLEKAQEMKSRFFANISHEIKTPLALVFWPLQNLIERSIKENNVSDVSILNNIKDNLNKLKILIDEILDLSKLEAGKMVVNEQATPIIAFVEALLEPFHKFAKSKNINLNFNNNGIDDVLLNIDQSKFEKIVNNLLSNAIKFSNQGSSVVVDMNITNNNLEVIVNDAGQGIAESEIGYIFDRFYQTSHHEIGSGIGLALSQELAEMMDGEILVKSVEGEGSTFTLILPVKRSNETALFPNKTMDKSQAVFVPATNLSATQNKTEHVLLVEDNLEMSDFINKMLTPHYRITLAYNGQIAKKLIEEDNSFDLIVSDIMMPELDGISLLKWIKENHDLPVILITSLNTENRKIEALQIGVDDYLNKPFSPTELNLRIRNLLNSYKKRTVNDFKKDESKTIVNSQNSFENQWIKQVEAICTREIGNSDFVITLLANELSMSERQLYRKLNKLTGLTPNNYLRELRLHKAMELLESKTLPTVAEVAFAVGFETPAYFSRLFKKRFGKSPKLYL